MELSAEDVDRFGTPSLTTRITNDVNQVQVAIALGIRQLIRWPLLAVGSMVAALLIDVRLGLHLPFVHAAHRARVLVRDVARRAVLPADADAP
jgi:ABC-type multidrug transport system fused ATPase/permease subunit